VSTLTRGPSLSTPTRRPSDPARCRVLLSSRAKRGQKTNSASCPREAARCRHVNHAARIAMPSALQAGRPVRRVVMSPLSGVDPPATLVQTPSACQMARRFTERHSRGAPQRSAEMPPLPRFGNPLRRIPESFQQSTLRRRDPNPPPPSPQRTSAAIPTRDLSAEDLCAKSEPCSFPWKEPHTECSRMLPPSVPTAPLSCRQRST